MWGYPVLLFLPTTFFFGPPRQDPICPEPDEELPAAPPQLAAAETPPEAEAAVRSWDPATGQFVSEELGNLWEPGFFFSKKNWEFDVKKGQVKGFQV